MSGSLFNKVAVVCEQPSVCYTRYHEVQDMKWKTRITDLLGCKYPILQGAFAGFGNWEFAASVANTGAHGMITASVSGTPEKLKEDIRMCREATEGTFSVNFTLTHSIPWNEMLEICIEERVPLETAAYKPDDLVPRIKETGLTWIHKAARVKDAIRAAKLGADAVIIVGLEGTGFKSSEQLPTMISLVWALREIDVPVIALAITLWRTQHPGPVIFEGGLIPAMVWTLLVSITAFTALYFLLFNYRVLIKRDEDELNNLKALLRR